MFQGIKVIRRFPVGAVASFGGMGLMNYSRTENEAASSGSSSSTTYSSSASTESSFHGQCLKRQMHQPSIPYPAWDYNWDGMMAAKSSPEVLSTKDGLEASQNGTTRHILLVRHGQYDETYKEDEKRVLTPLGRRQAELTGLRLAVMARGGLGGIPDEFVGPCNIKAIHRSNMTRAKETASIIASHLPDVPITEPDSLLNEALPSPMIPMRPDISRAEKEIDDNHDRIEEAFHKYMHRSVGTSDDEEQETILNKDEFEIIVGHGNVIRYFFCRSLQLPPEAWLRMSTFNCSITYIMIRPNGYCSVRMLGDIGHLGYDNSTFSGNHGFNW